MAKKSVKKQQSKRTTTKVFDLLFKDLMHLSNKAVISFINGLFDTKYPLDSKVVYLEQEIVNENLNELIRDIVLQINGFTHHIEAQINFDADMMIRIFRYGFEAGVLKKTHDGDIRTIEFPKARIVYFESSKKTPKQQTLRLKFPDKTWYDYRVDTFNLLDHSVSELEKQGLALLLPFYVLKMRRQVQRAKTGDELKKLSGQLKALLDELLGAVGSLNKKGRIDGKDVEGIVRGMERLYKELFCQYKELAEGDIMLEEKLDYYTDKFELENSKKIAKNLLALDVEIEKIVKATGLPLKTIKALQAKLKVA
ncbi:hypothetical protein FACS1894190_00750 [Spirochaetia bacterium]|nr:hypothetical protein FACS1894190_00750 [Spirochaetia bacterium]